MTNYREQLIDALANLESVRNQLFDTVINVGMHGVHSDINEVFEEGDSYLFNLEHFDNTKDPNLQTLVNLIKHIDCSSQKLLRINDVSMEDVDVSSYSSSLEAISHVGNDGKYGSIN